MAINRSAGGDDHILGYSSGNLFLFIHRASLVGLLGLAIPNQLDHCEVNF